MDIVQFIGMILCYASMMCVGIASITGNLFLICGYTMIASIGACIWLKPIDEALAKQK